MEKISYNRFNIETRNKKVKYVWTAFDMGGYWEGKTDKFYCNRNYKTKMFSIPDFFLCFGCTFYKVNEKEYKSVSRYGETIYTIMNTDKYKKAYYILMEYWDSLPDEQKPLIDKRMKKLGL